MSARATGWSLAALVAVTGCGRGCGDGEPPAPAKAVAAPDAGGAPTPGGSGALGRYARIAVPADYEAEVAATIDATNYREVLERLERDFATK